MTVLVGVEPATPLLLYLKCLLQLYYCCYVCVLPRWILLHLRFSLLALSLSLS